MKTELELLYDGQRWTLELTDENGDVVLMSISHEQKQILESAGVPYYGDR